MGNFNYYIKQNQKSFELIKKIYPYDLLEYDEKTGIIKKNHSEFKINNKIMLIHNYNSLKFRRENKNNCCFLDFSTNAIQRNFIIDKTLKKLNAYIEKSEIYNNKYCYKLLINDEIKEVLISKIDSNKKIIALLYKYFNIK